MVPLAVDSALWLHLSASTEMIWLITIVTFLSALIAVMLVYWFILQGEQVLAALRKPEEHRMEARIPRRVGLELSGPDKPPIYEITFTENVSLHGARVVTKRRWSPNDCVLVKLPEDGLPARARISYCQPSKEDEFAMGLQFSLAIYDWDRLPVGAMHSHFYQGSGNLFASIAAQPICM